MAGIQIGIASETKAFKQGIETGLIAPLEDAVEALDDLGKSKGPDKLEDGFEDAQKASKKLEREVKDTADTIEKEFKKSYASVKQSSDKGMDGAEDGMKDFKQEANSTAKESAASFDGSAESIVDAFQEIAANAFQGFGPAGAVAGLAAAAGIGLVGAAFTQAGEDAEALAERTVDAFDKMIEAQSIYFTAEQINSSIHDLLSDENTQTMIDLTKDATSAGVDLSVMLRARAGDTKALIVVQDAMAKKNGKIADSLAALEPHQTQARQDLFKQEEAIAGVNKRLDEQAGINANAADSYRLYNKSTSDSAFANEIALTSVDNLTDGVGKLGSGLNQVPKEVTPHVTVKYDIDDRNLQKALEKSYAVTIRGALVDRAGKRTLI